MKVKVFKPIIIINKYEKLVLYPYVLFKAKLVFKRLVLSPKIMICSGILDLCRGRVLFLAQIPEITHVDYDKVNIIPQVISDEEARNIVEYEVLRYGISKINTWWEPDIRFIEYSKVYKVFYVVKENGKLFIVDSLTGDKKLVST